MNRESTVTDSFFSISSEQKFLNGYRKLFSLHEFANNIILQWALGALIFAYFIALAQTPHRITLSAKAFGDYVCPEYFQDCSWLYFFQNMPLGYSQSLLYMGFFSLLVFAVYGLYRKDWTLSHMMLLPIWVWHTALTLFLSDLHRGNYEYYVIVFGITLLLIPHKEFFTKLAIVWLYVLSTIAKIHPSWVLGTYFSSMKLGLPLVPDVLIPVATNIVIFCEMIMAWFLFSSNKLYQRTALAFFIFFHLYSGILVQFRYPATILPMLLVMFGPLYRSIAVPIDRRAIAGFVVMGLFLLGQVWSLVIPGDSKLTGEGMYYGLYMFDSNHQCQSNATVHLTDGGTRHRSFVSDNPRDRCRVYHEWYRQQTICSSPDVERISWQFDHAINGAPFLRIVDTEDSCQLDYKAFSHNAWIKTYANDPEVVGRPLENYYY